MSKQIIDERNRVVLRGDPQEAKRFIVAHGGSEPPSDTDWSDVFMAARKCIVGMAEFDETYNYGALCERDMAVADDLIFPRNMLLAELKKIGSNR